MIQQQKKLTETKQALYDALHKQRKINEDLEHIKKRRRSYLKRFFYTSFFILMLGSPYIPENCTAFQSEKPRSKFNMIEILMFLKEF